MKLENSEHIISELENLSNQILRCKEDLKLVIDSAIASNNYILLNDLAFQAKYICGLQKVIQKKEAVDEEYFKKISLEFQSAYEKIKQLLQELIKNSSDFIKNIFEEKYFQLTQNSLRNLNLLCDDLSILKMYLNDLKQKKDLE